MIEIYKKLPGTNCGECGEITCVAFAFKVKNVQRMKSDCPYVIESNEKSLSEKPAITMEDNYERVSKNLEKEARNMNFKEVAIATGGYFEIKNGAETLRLKMMNNIYELRKEGLFENDKYCNDSWSKIIVYDYVRRSSGRPLTRDWVTLGHFPDTASHVKAFQSKAEGKIAEAFNKKIDDLKLRCKELGGIEESEDIKADYVCRFDLLPRIPLYLCFWEADEEFQASCRLFVDSSADAYLDIEYLAYLLEKFVEVFVK